MAQRSKLSTSLCGVAGEYFVAAELSRHGYVASLTLKNTQGIDIIASSADSKRQVAIQVKTEQASGKEWMLSQKAEKVVGPNVFYVFMRLHGLKAPEYYVVPSNHVAAFTRRFHQAWLDQPGKKGQKHNDTPMRKFRDDEGKYLGAWHFLGLDSDAT